MKSYGAEGEDTIRRYCAESDHRLWVAEAETLWIIRRDAFEHGVRITDRAATSGETSLPALCFFRRTGSDSYSGRREHLPEALAWVDIQREETDLIIGFQVQAANAQWPLKVGRVYRLRLPMKEAIALVEGSVIHGNPMNPDGFRAVLDKYLERE